jgi:triacylglycerol lipase
MHVVLHHGIFAFDELRLGPLRIHQFPRIAETLRAAGHAVTLTRVHPCASIPRRAADLKASILDRAGPSGEPLLLIAHSLGGLDARYMLSKLDMAPRIHTLLTIATPHRGASLAEFWLRKLRRPLPLYPLLSALGLDIGAAEDLTRPHMAAFNASVPDHPAVHYYSISCACTRSQARPRLRLNHTLISREEGPNDGVVSDSSARWGTHLATWNLDHVQALNRPPNGIDQRYLDTITQIATQSIPPAPPP